MVLGLFLILAIIGQKLGKTILKICWPFFTGLQILLLSENYTGIKLPANIKILHDSVNSILKLEALPKKAIKTKAKGMVFLNPYFFGGIIATLAVIIYSIFRFIKTLYPEKVISLKKAIKTKVCNGAIRAFLIADLTLSFYALELLKSISTMNEHVEEAASILTAV